MLKTYQYQGKTEEEVFEQSLKELTVKKEDCLYQITMEQSKLFKTKKYQLTVLLKKDVVAFIKDYFETLSNNMNVEITPTITSEENNFHIDLNTSANHVLIGKEGKNLHALLTLLRQALRVVNDFDVHVSLDIADYRKKQLEEMEKEVKKIAEEVLESGIEASLDPMNSYERRHIHSIVATIPGLATKSVGEGRERHIVIQKENM